MHRRRRYYAAHIWAHVQEAGTFAVLGTEVAEAATDVNEAGTVCDNGALVALVVGHAHVAQGGRVLAALLEDSVHLDDRLGHLGLRLGCVVGGLGLLDDWGRGHLDNGRSGHRLIGHAVAGVGAQAFCVAAAENFLNNVEINLGPTGCQAGTDGQQK